jgi:hypothetical protein
MKQKICILIAFMAVALLAASAVAEEIQYPAVCYQGEELQQLRQWEKKWVGKNIGIDNVDEVKEFLPESFYNIMKDVSRWGETWFEIVPYETITPTPGNIAMTKKYNGTSKLGPEGEIIGYVSGVPFPDTKNATEMGHNFRTRSFGDAYTNRDDAYIVDGRLKYDRNVEIKNTLAFFSGRTDYAPVPELPKNPKMIWRAFSMLQLQPPETRNMRIMEINYKDTRKPYDSWFWMPAIRRVRRRSTSERQDAQGGADYCAYDNMGWDGAISVNNYKYLGQQDLLMGRHTNKAKLVHTEGKCLFDGTQRERIKVHVVEATSKDPNFLYSKMIWYLDPEDWQMRYSDRYDRSGKLWKIIDNLGFIDKGPNDLAITHFNATQTVDVQRTHSTVGLTQFKFGVEVDQKMFRPSDLQRRGY